ncbi:Peptidyl-prolyl isomerase cwc27 [Maudiozyma exigua]|uniref:Peptidyl-prolyl isomerase cwc27 n=1 Tax=Maudiozyma exigua TaxID=34358 RepID=A0A9P7B9F3_MAUEX|nr:Peptidyl-prolyl isomerase cwc27 [Kazachstania exigua]
MSVLRTTAKCEISTSKGNLEVELWAKECPNTCRNFMNIALSNDFNGDSFNNYLEGKYLFLERSKEHLEKGGSELKVEWNSRFSITQDGILCWNPKKRSFFISTGIWTNYPTNEFTIFGMVVGESIYKLREWLSSDIDTENNDKTGNKKFIYPPVIENVDITIPYFTDLIIKKNKIPRMDIMPPKTKLKAMPRVVLSFDDDDEGEVNVIPKIKMKASPLLNRKRKIRKVDSLDRNEQNEHGKPVEVITDIYDADQEDDKNGELPHGSDTNKVTIETEPETEKPKNKLDAMELLKKMKSSNNGKGMFS